MKSTRIITLKNCVCSVYRVLWIEKRCKHFPLLTSVRNLFSFIVPFIRLLAKLWTIPPVYIDQNCRICQCTYSNQFQHAVLGFLSTAFIRDSFYNSLINNFDVRLYVELSQLRDDVLYYILLGGFEPTTLLDKESKKEFICICAKFVCSASACYNRALLFLEHM